MVDTLLRFCIRLRKIGLDIGPDDVTTAALALRVVDLTDREQVFLALQAVLCRKVEDFKGFGVAFAEVWDGQILPEIPNGNPGPERVPDQRDNPAGGQDDRTGSAATDGDNEAEGTAADPDSTNASYSVRAMAKRDLGTLGLDEVPEFERLAQTVARRLARAFSVRRKRGRRGTLDAARTLREALRNGGEILRLRRRRHRREKARLVSLLDVSGSMQPYGRFFLCFIAALTECVSRMETYLFSTGLSRVTRELRLRDIDQVMRAVPDWGSGTRIGSNLAEFLQEHAPRIVDRRTVFVIMSDGLDTGDIETLDRAMARLKRLGGQIIWLNPLAGDPDYEPLARAMRTALPYLDLLAPAHSIESLLQLGSCLKGGAV